MAEPARPRPRRGVEMRERVLHELGIDTIAWSADGRGFGYVARLGRALPLGGYVRITTPAGDVLLGQVQSRRVAQSDLGTVGGPGGVALRVPVRHLEGGGRLLARIAGRRLGPLDGAAGFGDASVAPATARDVAAHRRAEIGGSTAMELGVLTHAPGVRADVRAAGFNRHTLLCGQSGSGKTFATGVLLEQILANTTLPFIVLDPNSDHVHLAELRSFEDYNRTRRVPLSRSAYERLAARYRRAASGVSIASTRPGDVALKARFSHLTIDEQALCLRLDPIRDIEEYNLVVHLVAGMAGRNYTVADLVEAAHRTEGPVGRRLAQRIENLRVADWRIWAANDEPAIGDTPFDRRGMVVDTGSLDDPRERAVAALVLFGRLRRRDGRSPLLVVIDEAHDVCPPRSDDALGEAVTAHVAWAAGEGRKYGTFLLLATQRPQKLHPNVVSQCENIVLMRVNSHTDRDHLAALFSQVPEELVQESAAFGLGEALVAGPCAPTPAMVTIGGRLSVEGGADLPTDWARG
ncbi:MAG: hypothetical protein KatS3mg009_0565 [Acidimicrobiia bacterium]|nr:MAG: hypothetical protein KatS3mg009_0565 [Acidimicrobiia bacterium]